MNRLADWKVITAGAVLAGMGFFGLSTATALPALAAPAQSSIIVETTNGSTQIRTSPSTIVDKDDDKPGTQTSNHDD